MFSDVRNKLKKKNKILFSRDSQCLQELIKLIQLQNHRTLVMWALDCAKLPLEQFETKYPDERRPRTCLELCEVWARGKIKMPAAKQAILDSHAVAKKIDDSEYGALCHAIGHAGATAHVETHALGLPIYELTAIVLKYGKENFPKPVNEKINYYYHRLQYWQENTGELRLDWVDFLLDNTSHNKERLLSEKRKLKQVQNTARKAKPAVSSPSAKNYNLDSTPYWKAKPGEIITFGTYPQTAEGADRTPIKWRVLQNSGSELFILSEDILDCKRYHGKSADITWDDCVDITWRDCDLRKWLNDEFYNTAFNPAEKEFIKTTHCTENGEGRPDTEDKVFLLSVNEIKDASDKVGKDLRRAVGTDFAKTKKPDGCSLYVYDKSKKVDYMIIDGKEVGCSWWWLRTQGNKPSRAFFIGTNFSIRSYGNNSIARYGVRPALKINLQ